MAATNGAKRGGANGGGGSGIGITKARETSYQLSNNFYVSEGDKFTINGLVTAQNHTANVAVTVKKNGIVSILALNNASRSIIGNLNKTRGIANLDSYTGNMDDIFNLIKQNEKHVTFKKK